MLFLAIERMRSCHACSSFKDFSQPRIRVRKKSSQRLLRRHNQANAALTTPLPGINLQGHPARGADEWGSLSGSPHKDSIDQKGTRSFAVSFMSGIWLIPRPDGGGIRLIVGGVAVTRKRRKRNRKSPPVKMHRALSYGGCTRPGAGLLSQARVGPATPQSLLGHPPQGI